jgi:hypothetical protein
MASQDSTPRTVLPIPEQPRKGLVLYDAKDPENKYPSITQFSTRRRAQCSVDTDR